MEYGTRLTAREGLREKLGQPFHLSDLMTSTEDGNGRRAGNAADVSVSQSSSHGHPNVSPLVGGSHPTNAH